MIFDFDEFSKLAQTNPALFEQRRSELLQAEIAKAPEHKQAALKTLQHDLDQQRKVLNPKQFIHHCMTQINQNLDDLQDQWKCISVLASSPKS